MTQHHVLPQHPFRRVLGSLILGFVLFASAAPTGAAPKNPMLHQGSCASTCWASYVFRTHGQEVEFQIEALNVQLPLQLGAVLYDANSSGLGDKRVFAWTYLLLDADDGVLLDLNPERSYGAHVDTRTLQSTRNSVSLTVTMNDEESVQDLFGKYRLLMWAAGTADTTNYGLHGQPGSKYLGTDSGSRTFLYTSADFRGTANVQAGNGQAEGRLNWELSKTLNIQDTMIGIFGTADGEASEVDELYVDTPVTRHYCGCFFSNFAAAAEGLPPAGPGRYDFHIPTGADIAPGNSAEIILGGADARLSQQTVDENVDENVDE